MNGSIQTLSINGAKALRELVGSVSYFRNFFVLPDRRNDNATATVRFPPLLEQRVVEFAGYIEDKFEPSFLPPRRI